MHNTSASGPCQNVNGETLFLSQKHNYLDCVVVVDSCKLVFDGMYIFREAFRLLAVLFNQLSKSLKKCYQAV